MHPRHTIDLLINCIQVTELASIHVVNDGCELELALLKAAQEGDKEQVRFIQIYWGLAWMFM
jgi:hypothetical protein